MSEWTPAMEAELRMLIVREYRAQQVRDSMCNGKAVFNSPEQAREAMPRRTIRGTVTVYHCRLCRKWHIGSHIGRNDKQKIHERMEE